MNLTDIFIILKRSKDKGIQEALEEKKRQLQKELDQQFSTICTICQYYTEQIPHYNIHDKTNDELKLRIVWPYSLPQIAWDYHYTFALDARTKELLDKLNKEYVEVYNQLKAVKGY